jgi:flagellar motor switch/type III secretory pathway protein FliN
VKKVLAPDAEAPRKYELWRPIIQPQRRLVFERLHHRIAESWSHTMAGYLPGEKRFEFEGLGFEVFRDFKADDCHVVVFAIDQARVSGFLMLTGAVARILVNARLGIKSLENTEQNPGFTRIETGVMREAIRSMLARLSATYQEVGLGRIAGIRDCERLGDTLMFAPEDYLAVLRYRIGPAADGLRVTVALSSNAINAVHEPPHASASGPQSREVARIAGQLPVTVDIVLGAWKTPLRELRQLQPGDQIILPDGEDGWLAANNVRLRMARIQFVGRTTNAEIKRSTRLR